MLPHSQGITMAKARAGPATMATVTSFWEACTTGAAGSLAGAGSGAARGRVETTWVLTRTSGA